MTPNIAIYCALRHERKEPVRIKGMHWDIIVPKISKAEHRKRIMRELNNNPRFKEQEI